MRAIPAIAFVLWAGIATAAELNRFSSFSSSSSSSSSSESNEKQVNLRGLRKASTRNVPLKVYARNVEDDVVLQDMAHEDYAGSDSDVYTLDKEAELTWRQSLNIRRREEDTHYSLAFDRETYFNQMKVLTDDGEFPISRVYNKSDSSKAQWKLLKVENATAPGVYQIISVSSNLALSTKENTALPYLVEPNSHDGKQQWDFRDVNTDEVVLFEIPKCLAGNREEYPRAHTQCYAPDAGTYRALPGTCTGYLECQAYSKQRNNCIWAAGECPEGKYFNQVQEVCVPREDADCSALLFGPKAKMVIGNAKHDRVLDSCQDCHGSAGPFPRSSPVVGAAQKSEKRWFQILVATKRDGSDYYSFAFDRVKDEVFKVLTEEQQYTGPSKISSIRYEETKNMAMDNIEWRIVPTLDSGRYQIVSRKSKKALAMTNIEVDSFLEGKFYALETRNRDENDAAQLWSFQLLDSSNAHNHRNGGIIRQYYYPKYNSSFSLSSSSEEVSRVGSLRTHCQRSPASSRTQNGFPTPNSRCYQEEVLRKSSSPNSCKTYLECEPHSCEWREHHCSGSRYWNNAQKKCVQDQQEATCGATIFSEEAKVYIQSVHYGKVLDLDSSLPDRSTVIGFGEQAQKARNQVLVAKRRGNDEFYSLAFHKRVQGQEKILADNGSGQPVAMTYIPTSSSPSQWKFAPIHGNRNAYQIISTKSHLALQMNRINGHNEFPVNLVLPDQREEKQQWLIKDAETGELLPGNQQRRHLRQNDEPSNGDAYYYEDPSNCHQYYMRANGISMCRVCPKGRIFFLVFDPECILPPYPLPRGCTRAMINEEGPYCVQA